ncbi:MAG: chemotaxis protein CheW [Candidatus Deferrimicrobiaceae bacterium]
MAKQEEKTTEAAKRGGKYLTFDLDDEIYGVNILKVKEIIGIMDITPVPQAPPHVKGVLNLRGKIIPVMDLRLKFGFKERAYDERTCVIVVELANAAGMLLIGIIVDSVSEVTNITEGEIESTPDLGGQQNTEYIEGMAKMKGKVVILLNIAHVLSFAEVGELAGAA